jgi:two-component system, OmpR family, sensor histidine kinase KdpD
MARRAVRLAVSIAGVAAVTWALYALLPVNAATAGFAYLLLVLAVATVWGFWEACLASIAATVAYNLFFLPPVGRLTIADPQNWIALLSFLTTALVASRLSFQAKRQARDAVDRQRDVERLYTFSRAILLMGKADPFPKQLVRKLAEAFDLKAVVLYERRADEFHRAGAGELGELDEKLKHAALHGTYFADAKRGCAITAVRLGTDPIAALAIEGEQMSDAVVQGISNLVAIGLERARAQELEAQVEAANRSEKLRMTLLDAMAHEFQTPLTSVLGATSSLLDNPAQAGETRLELLKIADEEARRLKELIEDTVEMGRLDTPNIQVQPEPSDLRELAGEVLRSTRAGLDGRPVEIVSEDLPRVMVDRRLLKLALKQLVDNALKYSPADTPVVVRISREGASAVVSVTDRGKGIPVREQGRIFERLYRSPSVERQIPGSGLGLSIALNIARAHGGDLAVASRPGETTFRLALPANGGGPGE